MARNVLSDGQRGLIRTLAIHADAEARRRKRYTYQVWCRSQGCAPCFDAFMWTGEVLEWLGAHINHNTYVDHAERDGLEPTPTEIGQESDRHAIRALLLSAPSTLQELAAAVSTSPRTVQRRLKEMPEIVGEGRPGTKSVYRLRSEPLPVHWPEPTTHNPAPTSKGNGNGE
jgi:hypothetical protein